MIFPEYDGLANGLFIIIQRVKYVFMLTKIIIGGAYGYR